MQQSFNRLLHLRFYIIACLVISVFVVLFKPIYSRNFSKLPTTFAPVHITIATTDLCESYGAVARIGRPHTEKIENNLRFYTHSAPPPPPPHISNNSAIAQTRVCAIARNTITTPISYLALRAYTKSLEQIEFISITIGSKNFYLSSKQIQEYLKIDRFNMKNKPELQSASIDFDIVTLDLSEYKFFDSGTFINQYSLLVVDLIYYFIAPPYFFIWLFCIIVFIYVYCNHLQNLQILPTILQKISQRFFMSKSWFLHTSTYILLLIFFLALFLRLYNYNVFPLWGDELYSVIMVGYPDGDFSSVFLDPGNPPFYNFLLKIWLHLFGYTSSAARSLSVLLGSIGVFGMYVLLRSHFFIGPTLKRHTNHSVETHIQNQREAQVIALLGALFFACSFVGIGAAHEVRGYVLELTLVPFVLYFLFNCLKNLHFFNAFLYVLTASLLCNTHYYGAIMIFASFIVSIFLLYGTPKWRKKIVIMFILNILIACSLMPYFIITAYNQALTDTSFNTWIPAPSGERLLDFLLQSFGDSTGAVIFVFFCLLILRLRNTFLFSLLGVVVLVVLISFVVSFVRPIYYPKYAIYVTYALMLCVFSGGIVMLSRTIARTNVERYNFMAIGIFAFSIALFDVQIQPIGRYGEWDNSRAKLQFITQDSADKQNAYIIDLHPALTKSRQYALYNLNPNATFVTNYTKIPINPDSATLYLDASYVNIDTIALVLQNYKDLGATIQEIPFGIAFDINMNESQNVVYKVIFP